MKNQDSRDVTEWISNIKDIDFGVRKLTAEDCRELMATYKNKEYSYIDLDMMQDRVERAEQNISVVLLDTSDKSPGQTYLGEYKKQLIEALTVYVEVLSRMGFYRTKSVALTTHLFNDYHEILKDNLLTVYKLCAGYFVSLGYKVTYKKTDNNYIEGFTSTDTTRVEIEISWDR